MEWAWLELRPVFYNPATPSPWKIEKIGQLTNPVVDEP